MTPSQRRIALFALFATAIAIALPGGARPALGAPNKRTLFVSSIDVISTTEDLKSRIDAEILRGLRAAKPQADPAAPRYERIESYLQVEKSERARIRDLSDLALFSSRNLDANREALRRVFGLPQKPVLDYLEVTTTRTFGKLQVTLELLDTATWTVQMSKVVQTCSGSDDEVIDWLFKAAKCLIEPCERRAPIPEYTVVAPSGVKVGEEITLDACKSHDPDFDPFRAEWRPLSAPGSRLPEEASSRILRFTPAEAGVYRFELSLHPQAQPGETAERVTKEVVIEVISNEPPPPVRPATTTTATATPKPPPKPALAIFAAASVRLPINILSIAQQGPSQYLVPLSFVYYDAFDEDLPLRLRLSAALGAISFSASDEDTFRADVEGSAALAVAFGSSERAEMALYAGWHGASRTLPDSPPFETGPDIGLQGVINPRGAWVGLLDTGLRYVLPARSLLNIRDAEGLMELRFGVGVGRSFW
jgi:hypothetical protein